MELVASDFEGLHRRLNDFDAFLVGARVEHAFNLEAGLGRRCADQLDYGEAISERPAPPVLRDVAEQPMRDLVPLRCCGRIVVDADHEPGLVRQLLQFELPETHTRTIRAAAVGGDRQFPRIS